MGGLHQAVGSINVEPAGFDDEKIAQADTTTLSKGVLFQDNVEINEIKEKENDANIINIYYLKLIEMIENSSFNFSDISNTWTFQRMNFCLIFPLRAT